MCTLGGMQRTAIRQERAGRECCDSLLEAPLERAHEIVHFSLDGLSVIKVEVVDCRAAMCFNADASTKLAHAHAPSPKLFARGASGSLEAPKWNSDDMGDR